MEAMYRYGMSDWTGAGPSANSPCAHHVRLRVLMGGDEGLGLGVGCALEAVPDAVTVHAGHLGWVGPGVADREKVQHRRSFRRCRRRLRPAPIVSRLDRDRGFREVRIAGPEFPFAGSGFGTGEGPDRHAVEKYGDRTAVAMEQTAARAEKTFIDVCGVESVHVEHSDNRMIAVRLVRVHAGIIASRCFFGPKFPVTPVTERFGAAIECHLDSGVSGPPARCGSGSWRASCADLSVGLHVARSDQVHGGRHQRRDADRRYAVCGDAAGARRIKIVAKTEDGAATGCRAAPGSTTSSSVTRRRRAHLNGCSRLRHGIGQAAPDDSSVRQLFAASTPGQIGM